ncbi:MAG: MFS transporter [Eubacterium sp.]|nr:MFS transporter [Eubacterium sp.]
MAVTSIGSAMAAKTTDLATINLNDYQTTVYVTERNDAQVPTGNMVEITDGVGDITIAADQSEFDEAITFNQDNADYTITINGLELNGDNSAMNVVLDSVDSEDAAAIVYVNEEQYATLTAADEALSISGDISSTKEVERLGYKYFSLIVAVLFFVFILITCLRIKEKSSVDMKTATVKEMFTSLVQNDQAMTMVIAIVLVNTAVYITSNLLIYFFKYDLGGASWTGNYTLFNTFGGGMQIISMIIFFPLLRKFFSIMKVFYISVASAIIGYVILLVMALLGVDNVYPFFVPGFFIFAAVGMLNVIVTVFLANTVDYGELKNGRRDESVIFSMQTFVVKLASGVAALIASICLSVFHISESDSAIEAVDGSLVQGVSKMVAGFVDSVGTIVTENSVVGLRMTMTLLPILALIIAVVVFKKKYILTDEKLEEITAELKNRA